MWLTIITYIHHKFTGNPETVRKPAEDVEGGNPIASLTQRFSSV
jgi:hypothetical protein